MPTAYSDNNYLDYSCAVRQIPESKDPGSFKSNTGTPQQDEKALSSTDGYVTESHRETWIPYLYKPPHTALTYKEYSKNHNTKASDKWPAVLIFEFSYGGSIAHSAGYLYYMQKKDPCKRMPPASRMEGYYFHWPARGMHGMWCHGLYTFTWKSKDSHHYKPWTGKLPQQRWPWPEDARGK